jgi:phenylalanine-4-hydroxylase
MLPEDHPGFADPAYRARRSEIASIADSYRQGDMIPEVPYAPEEHQVWKQVSHILQALYPHFASMEYNECFENFKLGDAYIPQFSAVNSKLFDYCFSLSPVAGLVSPREFLEQLADSNMFCTQYIRHYSVPEYTPEPDVIHEIFGHAVFFLNEDMRKISRLFGRAAQKASDELVEDLIKVYWHTIEFGVCLEGQSVRAYGAGLLSSIDELSSIQDAPTRPFDIDEMKITEYDTMNPQPFLFCAADFQQVVRELTAYLSSLR